MLEKHYVFYLDLLMLYLTFLFLLLKIDLLHLNNLLKIIKYLPSFFLLKYIMENQLFL